MLFGMEHAHETPLALAALDGVPLGGRRFEPDTPARATVLVAPAMAVPQRFYRDFARGLAGRGFRAVTFDYRGVGASAGGRHPRRWEASVRTWATRDLAAVVDAAAERWPGDPVLAVGHSLGGQLVGLLPNAERLAGLVAVASGSGWVGHARRRRLRALQLGAVLPATTRLFGYFPGRVLGVLGDLPPGVALEWSRWCTSPHYVTRADGRPDRAGYRAWRGAILGLSFTDDALISEPAVDDLLGWYARARVDRRHVDPAAHGLHRVGHFGFFRRAAGPALWPLALDWLARRADEVRGRGGRVGERAEAG